MATSATLDQTIESPGAASEDPASDTTLLVVAGLLVRRLIIDGGARSELLGPGDVIRPWDRETIADLPAAPAMHWRVLGPAHVAVVNEGLLASAAPWPEVVRELISRSVRRAHWLAVVLTLPSIPRVEERLSVLFWHLAARWGRITPEGVRLKPALTGELIAELIGDPLPSIEAALTELSRTGVLRRDADGSWLLGALPGRAADSGLHIPPFAR